MKPNKLILKQFAREHRSFGTKGEAILWKYVLKNKKTTYTFNRQYVIDNYIVDFVCRKLHLIIEIDGSSHLGKEKSKYDYKREEKLKQLGFTIIRFEEKEVLQELELVQQTILDAINALQNGPNLSPLEKGVAEPGD
jgi:very-short-patch-repair endonuclease